MAEKKQIWDQGTWLADTLHTEWSIKCDNLMLDAVELFGAEISQFLFIFGLRNRNYIFNHLVIAFESASVLEVQVH